ncbi:glucosyltransferase domain-containing protein [Pseudofulvimonas gallinarii]
MGCAMRMCSEGPEWIRIWIGPRLLTLLVIFTLCYFHALANYSLQIDDELASVRSDPGVWLMQGRWGAYLFERWVVSLPAIPFAALFIFGVFSSIAYLVLLSAHGVVRPAVIHVLSFPVFAAFPTWMHLAAFSANIAAAGLALLFCCLFARAFVSYVDATTSRSAGALTHLMRAVVLAALATSIYQSFVITCAALGLGLLVARALAQPEASRPLRDLVMLMLILCLAVATYWIMNSIFLYATGLRDGGYVGNIVNIRHFFLDPLGMVRAALRNMAAVYGGSAHVFGMNILGFPLLILVGIVAIGALTISVVPSFAKRAVILAMIGVLVLVPFSLDILSGGMPVRTMVAVPSAVWFFTMAGLTSGQYWLEKISVVALLMSLLGLVQANNLVQSVDMAVRHHDRQLAADLYRRIAEVQESFDSHKIYAVDIHGALPFQPLQVRPMTSTWGYSFFEWDGGNLLRMVSYMRLLGYTNLVEASADRRRANLSIFSAMPRWPAPGSVVVHEGNTLIKLGDMPGYPFNVP